MPQQTTACDSANTPTVSCQAQFNAYMSQPFVLHNELVTVQVVHAALSNDGTGNALR